MTILFTDYRSGSPVSPGNVFLSPKTGRLVWGSASHPKNCWLLVGAQEHYDCVGCLWVNKNIMTVLVACGCIRTF